MTVMVFCDDIGGVCYAGLVVLLPDVFDLVRGLFLDQGHFHDLAEFARAWVGECHPISTCPLQHN